MENKPRTRGDIESEFAHSHSIVSCFSDLLGPAQENKAWVLDEDTILNAGFICFEYAEKMRSLFLELLELDDVQDSLPTDSEEKTIYQSGILKGRKECWEVVHAMIADKDNRQGNGMDKVAETNGLVLASSAIFEMINSPAQQ